MTKSAIFTTFVEAVIQRVPTHSSNGVSIWCAPCGSISTLANVIWVSGPGNSNWFNWNICRKSGFLIFLPFQSWGFHEFPVKLPNSEIVAVAEVHKVFLHRSWPLRLYRPCIYTDIHWTVQNSLHNHSLIILVLIWSYMDPVGPLIMLWGMS